MNDKNFTFQVSPPSRFLGSNSYHEAGKNYFLFNIFLNENHNFIFWNKSLLCPLIVPNDNSDLVNQFKNAKKTDLFTTSLTNLKFKPNFITFDDEKLNGLMIKDTSQVQKSTNNQLFYPEFTFKVIKQSGFKKMEGYKPENKILELEVEPFNLGIEGLPKITKITFYFFTQDPSHITPVDKELNKEKYEKLFLGAEGKEFTIKPKKIILGDRQITQLGKPLVYDTLSFSLEGDIEKIFLKENSLPNPKPEKVNNNFPNTASKAFLIAGGIIIGLLLITFVFYLLLKKKGSFKK